MFSAIILTLNEEANLPDCIASLKGCDDIVVLDSHSVDATKSIALELGARVFERRFDDFAGQRNWAHEQIPFRHSWVFHLDADERMTPELLSECATIAARDPLDIDAYFCAPRMLWEGTWVPRCTDYPAYQARFGHRERFHFVQVGHGQRETPECRMGTLRANYLHEMASGGEQAWLDKHRRYARQEAEAYWRTAAHHPLRLGSLFSKDRMVRRRAAKHASYRLPLRPTLRFVYQYILRGGFLDGKTGFRYCRLLSRYEAFASAELKRLIADGARHP